VIFYSIILISNGVYLDKDWHCAQEEGRLAEVARQTNRDGRHSVGNSNRDNRGPPLFRIERSPQENLQSDIRQKVGNRSREPLCSLLSDGNHWRSLGKSEKSLSSMGLPILRPPKMPLKRNGDFCDWQTVRGPYSEVHLVRDEGVAGSNPATPTIT
jgi:hypothetical protein